MKVFDINLDSQQLVIIPRFYPTANIEVTIKCEGSSDEYIDTLTNDAYVIENGYLSIILDTPEFLIILKNNSKYQITIKENSIIVYRGKAIATNQETQDYKLTKDLYVYE